jgi:hypothetical protein
MSPTAATQQNPDAERRGVFNFVRMMRALPWTAIPAAATGAPGSQDVVHEPCVHKQRRRFMTGLVLSPRLLGFVVGTRAALGFGVGLLMADKLPAQQRRRIGLALTAIGAATTVPAAVSLYRSRRARERSAD